LRAKRSNPSFDKEGVDCFVASLLAMTAPVGRTRKKPAVIRDGRLLSMREKFRDRYATQRLPEMMGSENGA
jgi:hypothetical protein